MIDVDFDQLPFSLLDDGQRERLKAAMEMAFFEAGEVLLEARHPARSVYLVHKGAVLELALDPNECDAAGASGAFVRAVARAGAAGGGADGDGGGVLSSFLRLFGDWYSATSLRNNP